MHFILASSRIDHILSYVMLLIILQVWQIQVQNLQELERLFPFLRLSFYPYTLSSTTTLFFPVQECFRVKASSKRFIETPCTTHSFKFLAASVYASVELCLLTTKNWYVKTRSLSARREILLHQFLYRILIAILLAYPQDKMPKSTPAQNRYATLYVRTATVHEMSLDIIHGTNETMRTRIRTVNDAVQFIVDPRLTVPAGFNMDPIIRKILRANQRRFPTLWHDIHRLVRRELSTIVGYGWDASTNLTHIQRGQVIDMVIRARGDAAWLWRIRRECFSPLQRSHSLFENLALEMAIGWIIDHTDPPTRAAIPGTIGSYTAGVSR